MLCFIFIQNIFLYIFFPFYIQATNLAQHVLNQHVLEQWLVADLREIGASCLPVDELQQQKVMLGGNYSLQVHKTAITQPKLN